MNITCRKIGRLGYQKIVNFFKKNFIALAAKPATIFLIGFELYFSEE
jgi:hypothetical protein